MSHEPSTEQRPTREDCVVGFLAGWGNDLTAEHLNEHLIEMGYTPRARFRDEMRSLVTAGFVENVRGKGYRFTITGRAWAVLKYGHTWLIEGTH